MPTRRKNNSAGLNELTWEKYVYENQ